MELLEKLPTAVLSTHGADESRPHIFLFSGSGVGCQIVSIFNGKGF